MAEVVGVLTNIVWVGGSSFVLFWVLDKVVGNRTTARGEIEGLDISEMGVPGYAMEDPPFIQLAGEEHVSTHGPGVPPGAKADTKRNVPVGRT
jgi:hypothetical protein